MKTNKAVFLDRDGVINYDTGYVHKIKDFKWTAGVKKGLKKLTTNNFKIIIITNQAGIARGYYKRKDVTILHKWLKIECRKEGAIINDFFICPHHPTAGLGKLKKKCKCRKPNNLLIKKAIKKWKISKKFSFMIGDKKTDYQCAKKSGIKFFYKKKNRFDIQINNILKNFNL